jgi:poly(3-hydroxybutyrate) depolymerase
MIRLCLLVLLAFTPLISLAGTPGDGCENSTLSSGTYEMIHDGYSRTYQVFVPKDYDEKTPAPLVTVFHGWGGDESEFMGDRTVISEANKRGYILVAPRGLGSGNPDNTSNSWSFSGSTTGLDGDGLNVSIAGDTDATCDNSITTDYSYPSCELVKSNSCSWTQCLTDDVAYVTALVDEIKARLCIDTDNVFASGGSNGGMFSWELAQNSVSAPTFRAIASLIGLPHRAFLDAKHKDEDMPALLITGTRDIKVPPGAWEDPAFTTSSNDNDRYHFTGATAITRSWAAAHAGCDISSAVKKFNAGYTEADCRTYCSDDPGWPRVLDCRANMDHSQYNFHWSWKLIMDFFDAHSVGS